ncbi:hypothetical protein AB0D99_30495 [Streptomyces sp. NPDC047971]|uniref:hypothetical protein n=1 Tax=Streptomyces sp. NPDC047971 TaxID=3154499 RepID=UPI0033F989C7
MSEWGIALIAAGAAIAGSVATGFFAWKAGHRQAAAAEAAGHAQANALIATVQATLDEQRRARAIEQRRQVYVQFLDAAGRFTNGTGVLLQATPSAAYPEDVRAALFTVILEGPPSVADAARDLVQSLAERRPAPDSREAAQNRFIEAARHALDET